MNFRPASGPRPSLGLKSRQSGRHYEAKAEDFLIKQGLKPVTRNFISRFGEIDLIMRHQQTLVFIEVRFRKHLTYGSPFESIDFRKQQKIIKTARFFLLRNGLGENHNCRFDALGVVGSGNRLSFHWLQNAFQ